MNILRIFPAFCAITISAADLSSIRSPLNPEDPHLQEMLKQSSGPIRAALAFINHMEHPCNWEIEYPIVASIIRDNNLVVGVEIGVAYGGKSEYILQHTDVIRLFSVDPYRHFETDYSDVMNFSQSIFDVLHIKTLKRLEPYGDRSQFVRKTSVEAAALFPDNRLDFVYIDGNHSYEAVRDDIRAWYGKIRSGGFMIGDDYRGFPGLRRAVNEFCAQEGLQLYTQGEKWWVVKP